MRLFPQCHAALELKESYREGKQIQPQLTNVSTVSTENGRLHAQHHFVPHPQCVLCMFDP